MEAILPQRAPKKQEAIGMFPKEAQDAVFMPPEQRTPMHGKCTIAAPADPHGCRLATACAEKRNSATPSESELAKFDHLNLPIRRCGSNDDASGNAPPTYLLSKGSGMRRKKCSRDS